MFWGWPCFPLSPRRLIPCEMTFTASQIGKKKQNIPFPSPYLQQFQEASRMSLFCSISPHRLKKIDHFHTTRNGRNRFSLAKLPAESLGRTIRFDFAKKSETNFDNLQLFPIRRKMTDAKRQLTCQQIPVNQCPGIGGIRSLDRCSKTTRIIYKITSTIGERQGHKNIFKSIRSQEQGNMSLH